MLVARRAQHGCKDAARGVDTGKHTGMTYPTTTDFGFWELRGNVSDYDVDDMEIRPAGANDIWHSPEEWEIDGGSRAWHRMEEALTRKFRQDRDAVAEMNSDEQRGR